MARFSIALVCALFPMAIASAQSDMDDTSRQRMTEVSSHLKQIAQSEKATVVRGSVRMFVFGAGAAVGFYALEDTGGTQQQRMFVMETQTDFARGEAAPPISGPHITMKRYHTKQAVVGDGPVGGKGRTLDVAQAQVQDETAIGFYLLATVTVPITGASRSVTYKISHPLKTKRATITEAGL
jgi:hypothetical protein